VFLFCIGSDTDWRKVVAIGTAQQMLIRGLIERQQRLRPYRSGPWRSKC
jgi:hypothetical protein